MKIIEQTLEESNAYSWFGNMQLDQKQQQMIIFGDKIFSITLINFRSYKKTKDVIIFLTKLQWSELAINLIITFCNST